MKMPILITSVLIGLYAYGHLGEAKTQQRDSRVEKTPPVGQRVYILEHGAATKVSIKKKAGGNEEGVILKDPTLKINNIELKKTQQPKPIVTKPAMKKPVEQPVKSASTMQFKKKRIVGNPREPRVQFARSDIGVGRRDEPIKRDFFEKVFEDLNDFEN